VPTLRVGNPDALDESRAYFVIVADRIDGEAGISIWRTE
jgi:hypothetical protein